MKKLFLALMAIIFINSCVSVEKYNHRIDTPIAPELLQKDVEIAYQQLQKYHPRLYWFTDKIALDKKFDSLKKSLKTPLKPNEFYYKLQPVIAQIKEGHESLRISKKKPTKEEKEKYKKLKALLDGFEFKIIDHQFYISKNKNKVQKIPVGAEIVSIDGIKTQNYLEKYKPLIASDGDNTTFHKYALAKVLFKLKYIDEGTKESANLEIKFNDSLKKYTIKRDTLDKYKYKKAVAKAKSLKKTKTEAAPKEKKKLDSLAQLKKEENETRYLKFLGEDSSIAYIKIKQFAGFSRSFYKKSFAKLQSYKTQNLIIDVRNNPGGSLTEINNLYGYFTDKPYQLITTPEIAFSKSNLQRDFFTGSPIFSYPFLLILYPTFLIKNFANSYKGNEGKFYMKEKAAKLNLPKVNHFKGKIYVLINGGSFSASSIITSKLKGDKRAILVGEETGGSNDGTVAGFHKTLKLPSSKLKLPINLMVICPNINFTNTKKGVTPDHEILPTANDLIQNKDPELDWVLNDIKAKN